MRDEEGRRCTPAAVILAGTRLRSDENWSVASMPVFRPAHPLVQRSMIMK
jgi:hypothetical protein